ncbi:MAG: dodecin domain-containing protein [Planctomycetaceae bacterium]|nr:dodecin domain-containing protein [Planctomycetaceae bacterium]
MEDHIYKQVEITGTSRKSIEDAIRNAINRASETLHNIRWFEVTNIRGDIDEAKAPYWQVSLKLGFRLDG